MIKKFNWREWGLGGALRVKHPTLLWDPLAPRISMNQFSATLLGLAIMSQHELGAFSRIGANGITKLNVQ